MMGLTLLLVDIIFLSLAFIGFLSRLDKFVLFSYFSFLSSFMTLMGFLYDETLSNWKVILIILFLVMSISMIVYDLFWYTSYKKKA